MIQTRNTCALIALTLAALPAAHAGVVAAASANTPAAKSSTQAVKPTAKRAMTRRTSASHHGTPISRYALPKHSNAPVGAPVLARNEGATRLQTVANNDVVRPIPLMPAFDAPRPARAIGRGTAAVGPPITSTEDLSTGESRILEFDGITTTAVGDPAVADIVPLSGRRLLINAKGTGTTTIFVFDSRGKNVITVNVAPGSNYGPIAQRIEQEIGIGTVTARAVNDTIFLEGSVPSQSDSDKANAIALAYAPKVKNFLVTPDQPHPVSLAEKYAELLNSNLSSSGVTAKVVDDSTIALYGKYAMPVGSYNNGADVGIIGDPGNMTLTNAAVDPLTRLIKSLPESVKVINLINFQQEKPKQILVRAKIIDIDRTATRSFGLNWGSVSYEQEQVGTTNQTQPKVTFQPLQTTPILFAQGDNGQFKNMLGGGGPLGRVLPFAAQLNALIQENKARVLSQPSLLMLDGNQGNMLVGGEFPIPIAQGQGAFTVAFKPFGVRLNVLPTIVADNTIQMTVTPEVSNLDFSTAVTFQGGSIPGVTVRRATTTLQLQDGQTLVIGGLYSTDYSKNVSRIPYLSNIPVLGEFFKNTTKQKIERELMVLIEAEIVKPDTLGATPPAPGSSENMDIRRPYVPKNEFDRDFPDIQNFPHKKDKDAPTGPISLPPTTPESAGK